MYHLLTLERMVFVTLQIMTKKSGEISGEWSEKILGVVKDYGGGRLLPETMHQKFALPENG